MLLTCDPDPLPPVSLQPIQTRRILLRALPLLGRLLRELTELPSEL